MKSACKRSGETKLRKRKHEYVCVCVCVCVCVHRTPLRCGVRKGVWFATSQGFQSSVSLCPLRPFTLHPHLYQRKTHFGSYHRLYLRTPIYIITLMSSLPKFSSSHSHWTFWKHSATTMQTFIVVPFALQVN